MCRVLDPAQPKRHLLPAEGQEVTPGEEVASGQAAGEVVDRRALHHRVVDVEERGDSGVGRHLQAGLDLRYRGRGDASLNGAAARSRPGGHSATLVSPERRIATLEPGPLVIVDACPVRARRAGHPPVGLRCVAEVRRPRSLPGGIELLTSVVVDARSSFGRSPLWWSDWSRSPRDWWPLR
jgi:hypothetical protein